MLSERSRNMVIERSRNIVFFFLCESPTENWFNCICFSIDMNALKGKKNIENQTDRNLLHKRCIR